MQQSRANTFLAGNLEAFFFPLRETYAAPKSTEINRRFVLSQRFIENARSLGTGITVYYVFACMFVHHSDAFCPCWPKKSQFAGRRAKKVRRAVKNSKTHFLPLLAPSLLPLAPLHRPDIVLHFFATFSALLSAFHGGYQLTQQQQQPLCTQRCELTAATVRAFGAAC